MHLAADDEKNKSHNNASTVSLHSPTGKQLIRLATSFFCWFFLLLINHMCRLRGGCCHVYLHEAKAWVCAESKGRDWGVWRRRNSGKAGGRRRQTQCTLHSWSRQWVQEGRGRCRDDAGPTEGEWKVWRKTSPQTIPSAQLSRSCLVAAAPASDTHAHTFSHPHTHPRTQTQHRGREKEREGRGREREAGSWSLRFETVIIADQVVSLKPRAGPHSSTAVTGRQHADLLVMPDSAPSRHWSVETLLKVRGKMKKRRG